MSDLRKRRGKAKPEPAQKRVGVTLRAKGEVTDPKTENALKWINIFLGVGVAVYLGSYYASYAKLLHENDMWFSNIGQVEREISFRTESGLYFSYFKQMVLAPSITQGLYELSHDNRTEHLRTINLLNRFNIYQEVFLGVLYKLMPQEWQNSIQYVYFYLNAIFGLHGIYLASVYVCAWMLSGTWLAGMLAASFYVFNRVDMTRLSYTMPLRESFSLPFIYIQIALVTFYFKPTTNLAKQKLCCIGIAISTFLLTITWQFAQFVLLLELFAFFGVYVLEYVPPKKIRNLYFIILGSILAVCILQFCNDMLYTSLAACFCFSGIFLILIQGTAPSTGGFFKKVLNVVNQIIAVLGLMYLLNFVIKLLSKVDSDEHVFKFVMSKFGYGEFGKKDFDALLYLCEGSFQGLPFDTFHRLTEGIVFPVYVMASMALMTVLIVATTQKLFSESSTILDHYPELAFHFMLTVFFGGMAMSTLRMKFLWMPHMCIMAAGIFCQQDLWKTCLESINLPKPLIFIIRQSIPLLILSAVLYKRYPAAKEELTQLREFHDPDTVQLMNWIKQATPKTAAFTASMQLNAGVKLCTDRPITNHPHYENKFLRQRTKEVYQIYARRSPSEVYNILRRHGTDYIILENSICYSRGNRGCRLPDVLDIDNGHELENDHRGPGDGRVPRFCHAIKSMDRNFAKYFKKVFENHTFYLYKLL